MNKFLTSSTLLVTKGVFGFLLRWGSFATVPFFIGLFFPISMPQITNFNDFMGSGGIFVILGLIVLYKVIKAVKTGNWGGGMDIEKRRYIRRMAFVVFAMYMLGSFVSPCVLQ